MVLKGERVRRSERHLKIHKGQTITPDWDNMREAKRDLPLGAHDETI